MIFTSNTTAKELLDSVIGELGLYEPPARIRFIEVLDEAMTRLYSEVIRHRERVSVTAANGEITYAALALAAGHPVHGEDISAVAVAATGEPLARIPLSAEALLPTGGEGYALRDDRLLLYPRTRAGLYSVTCLYRPTPITAESEGRISLRMASEYFPLLRAKLRGEGYKLAGEDTLAAKWLGEYNLLLAEFSRYVAEGKARECV